MPGFSGWCSRMMGKSDSRAEPRPSAVKFRQSVQGFKNPEAAAKSWANGSAVSWPNAIRDVTPSSPPEEVLSLFRSLAPPIPNYPLAQGDLSFIFLTP
jgi:hypothetical protein